MRVLKLTQFSGTNDGMCTLLPGTSTLRMLAFDDRLRPLPATAIPYCTLTVFVDTKSSAWFDLSGAECVDATAQAVRCELDRGYITVTR